MRTNMSKVMCSIVIMSMITLLAACGGSDGDNSSSGAQLPSGPFSGDWTASNNTNGEIYALISENEVYTVMEDSTAMSFKLSVSGASLTGHGLYYDRIDDKMIAVSGEVDVTGTQTENKLSLVITRTDGIIYQTTLSPVSELDGSASLDKLKGAYHSETQYLDINFSDLGIISGSNTNTGCVYNGDVEIPDPAVNMYKVYLNVTECKYSGAYTGLAAINDLKDRVAIMYDSGDFFMIDVLQ